MNYIQQQGMMQQGKKKNFDQYKNEQQTYAWQNRETRDIHHTTYK